MTKIIGAGGGGGGKGGGGGSKTPVTEPDSLDSKSYAKIVDLLSEGEIEGIKDGLKGVFLNNTPIQNADNSYNFQDVAFESRDGTDPQTLINGFGASATTVAVNREVTRANPNVGETVTVFSGPSTASNAPHAIRITLRIPALQIIEDDGDIVGTSVRIKLFWEIDGSGTWVEKVDDTITGRTGDLYKKDYLIDSLPSWNTGIKIRMVRETANTSDPTRTSNQTWFDFYVNLRYTGNTYPNSALAGLRINAEQFSSIPKRSYLVKGIKVRVPSNATVNPATGALIYSGTWNGVFGAAVWCSDPCWILWDVLTSQRYGLGDHILTTSEKTSFNGDASRLDKWAFLSASQYSTGLNTYTNSDEIAERASRGLSPRTGATDDFNATTGKHGVHDGFGGYEPRFSCNIVIRGKTGAFNVINALASVFRAMPYWSAGSVTVSQDKTQDSAYLFTLANVSPEGFSYSGSSQKTRATVAVIKYFDNTLRTYAYEEVKDTAAISKYGVITKNIEAFACTSRGQAQRTGKWLLYSEGNEVETVTFQTSLDAGCVVRPGQVIDVADPVKAGVRRGGRISAASSTSITIDGDSTNTDLPPNGVSYTRTLHVVSPTGTVETRTISDITGSVITVSSAFAAVPNVNSIWIIETTGGSSAQNIQTTQWRVISVSEIEQLTYEVVALAYNSSKFANIESGIALTQRDFSNLNEIPSPPTNLRIFQQLYKKGDSIRAKVIFSWDAVQGVNKYDVRWRKDSGIWSTHIQQGPDDEILDITPGTFEVKIYSLNAQNVPSNTALTGTLAAAGKTRPPSDVTWTNEPSAGFGYQIDPHLGLILRWNKLEGVYPHFDDLDVVGYEIRSGDANWGLTNNGTDLIGRVTANTFKVGVVLTGTASYFIKAYDTEAIYSVNATSQAITIGVPAAPSLTAVIEGDSATIRWAAVAVTGKYAIDFYEIYQDTIATGNLIGKVDTTRFLTPTTWSGNKTFHVRAVDIAGNLGTSASIVINNQAAAAPTISSTYVDNVVKLSWSEVHGSTPTRSYIIKQGSTSGSFGSASEKGRVKGTEFSLPVTWSTTQRFYVAAIDLNGNFGTSGHKDVAFDSPSIPTLSNTFLGEQVKLSWTAVTGSLSVSEYEVRRGATFASATVLGKVDGTTFSLKVDWGGTQKFWVVGIDVKGNYGTADDLDVVVNAPTAPTSFSQEVIDNNVLLRWSDATNTLPIVYYKIKKGANWASGTDIGTKQGLFTTVFETESGTFTYWIAGVDSAGNEGTPEDVTASVNEPPDYVLRSNIDSTFNGTKTNAFLDSGILYANINTTETYEQHFIGTGSSGSPQFPNFGSPGATTIYALPSLTTGSYVQEVDYGTALSGTKVVMALTGVHVTGTTTITPTISVKLTSGASWTDFPGNASTSANLSYSAFATNFRFVKYTLAFSSAGNDDLLKMTALNLKLEVKQKGDSGRFLARTETTGTYTQSGTTVTFSKTGHGMSVGDLISVDFTSGTTADGVYKIASVPNANSFTATQFVNASNEWTTVPSTTTSGNVTYDAGGTAVGFNTEFVDIESISVTPSGSSARIAIYDFVDAPNPKSFKVLLFDTSGTRVGDTTNTNFSWQVRGS